MNREEIIKLARESGLFVPHEGIPENGAFMRFAYLVAALEREACAKVAEEATASWTQHIYNDACMHIAAAIRARGNT